jgi:hypothetical protein
MLYSRLSMIERRKVGSEIGFETFIKRISDIAPHWDLQDLTILANKAKTKINFPPKTQNEEVVIHRKPRKAVFLDYNLELSANLGLSLNETGKILQDAYSLGKKLKLQGKQQETTLQYRQTADEYFESEFPQSWRKTSVTARTTIQMPESSQEDSRTKIEVEQNLMTISTNGTYCPHLENIVDILEPQFATVRLSRKDITKLYEQYRTGYIAAIQRRTRFDSQARIPDFIETIWRTKELKKIQDILDINLYTEGRVTNLYREYLLLSKNRRFDGLKRAAEFLDQIHRKERIDEYVKLRDTEQDRKRYFNTWRILTVDEEVTGSNINHLQVLPHATLYSMTIRYGENEISFGQSSPEQDIAHLKLQTERNGSELLKLQELVCRESGITFQSN